MWPILTYISSFIEIDELWIYRSGAFVYLIHISFVTKQMSLIVYASRKQVVCF